MEQYSTRHLQHLCDCTAADLVFSRSYERVKSRYTTIHLRRQLP